MYIRKSLFIIVVFMILPVMTFALTTKQLAVSINLAGKQRMLSQMIAKDIFLIQADINRAQNLKKLKFDRDLFDKTLNGLINGDKELKLKPIKKKEIQKQLKIVKKIWDNFDTNIKQVLSGVINQQLLSKVQKQNLTLLFEMNKAVQLYVVQSKESISKRAQAVNLSGKMRMLTQKMAKSLLLVSSNIDTKNSTKELISSKKMFAKILNGLQHGDKSLKLDSAKLPKIKRQLKKIKKQYKGIETNLNSSVHDKEIIKDTIYKLDALLIEVDKVVKLFEKSIKRAKQAKKLSLLVNQFIEKKNIHNNIINLAGKQRMLTQKMTKLVLLISLDIKTDKNKIELKKSSKLFEKTINALLKGDTSLNLPKTDDKNIATFINQIKSKWNIFNSNVQKVLQSKSVDTDVLDYLVEHNLTLLKMSNQLVKLFKAKTKQTFLEQARSNIVDIAGRQRMLSQKMTKEKLFVLMGMNALENEKSLNKSVKLFDNSLKALIKGDAKLKIVKPSNKKIKKQLQKVAKMWKTLKPLYLKEDINIDELNKIVEQNPRLLSQMNKVVSLSVDVADY